MLELSLPDIFAEPTWTIAPTVAEARSEYAPGRQTSPEPLYANPCAGVRLYHGDALELLRRAKSEMFDLIFADPPYFLSNDGITCHAGKMVSVNKGKWDRSEGMEADHAFNVSWLRECQRLLKPNGTLWITGTSHNIYSVGYALQTLGFKILNDIAWYKVNPPPNLSCRYFTHATETVLWAAKTAKSKHTFHYATMKAMNGGKQMQSLWHIKPPAAIEKRYGKHPTQKPEALLERIVQAASSEGDMVLDPFCGSGTTGVVCARRGRAFIGIDNEVTYLGIASARIQDEAASVQMVFAFAGTVAQNEASSSEKSLTWMEIASAALGLLGGEASLRDIYRVVEKNPRTRANATWMCTVRRVVRQYPRFEPVGRGRYRLQEAKG